MTLTRIDYTFVGWSTNSTATSPMYYAGGGFSTDVDTILYAIWKYNIFTVAFNPNGGNITSTNKNVTEGSPYGSLPVPTRTGYQFDGWFTAASGRTQVSSESTVNLTANQTLYAHWQANTYSIRYNANGSVGTMPNSQHTYDAPKALNTNTFSKEGFTFIGWKSVVGEDAVFSNRESVENLVATNGAVIELYAVWRQNQLETIESTITAPVATTTSPETAITKETPTTQPTVTTTATTKSTTTTQPMVTTATTPATQQPVAPKQYTSLWGKQTRYEATPFDWFFCIVFFGWLRMAVFSA